MYKILLLFFLTISLITSICAQSYVRQGNYSLAGSINYSSQYTYYARGLNSHTKIISISPSASYFIIDKLSVGLQLSYNYEDFYEQYSAQSPQYSANLSFGPLLKYYFIDNKVAPFVEAEYSHDLYNLGNNKDGDYLGYAIILGIGFNYFITNYFAIEPFVNYQYSLNKYWDNYLNDIEYLYYHLETLGVGIRLNYIID